ncbi:oxysterol-binding protein-related protein 3 isoform X5 [Pan troglodytes]|uniref:oxysterol-binding protein-related protein 3 isoform X5 n=1 Tax=Pan troglodytes TaxID=9598 RepID=UPI0023F1532D|nr:oxysterol-binding protein-related protein 3 isoform X6 [Pan troglodytes]
MMSDEKNLGVSQKLVSPSRSTSSCSSKQGSRQDSWEVVEGLRGEMNYTQEPPVQKGFLLKKRKWPLKGWHKRFFYLDKGILKYAKSQTDIEREKLHGCIDVGLSVMSVKKSSKCIDLDTEEHIYHLKVKSEEVFDEWVSKLRHHRMYRQNEIAMFPHEVNHFFSGSTITDSSSGVFDSISSRKRSSISKQNLFQTGSNVSFSCGGETRVPLWLQSSEDMEKCSKDLAHCHAYLVEMSQLLQSMDVLHRTYSAPAINAIQGGSFESPKKEKRSHRRWRSRAIGKDAKGTLQVPKPFSGPVRLHSSNPNLSTLDFGEEKNYSDGSETSSEFSKMQEDLCHIAHKGPVLDSGREAKSRRRTCLPAPCPSSSNISLWNILRNNIGKDLSKVAMPVELNEPLNTLQRLCEELEYSELLDKAAQIPSPLERMVYVAAFAISAYASSYYRAGSKPFNPVLGETYECIREDKGFQFFSEQVSHHPPISACHAESRNFVFWQDVRWKNKFWGKSMEIVPIGTTHVTLPVFGDHFEWNKVTSCIHNILSGQRWIEHYGEIVIKNLHDDSCYCKVNFIKAKYWSTNAHEIEGTVFDRSGKAVHRLFGKWHESIYCGGGSSSACVWRANPMPKGYEQYYSFTQFALELNEMDPSSKSLLPPTDTRFRPDQRFLEEGNLEEAEIQKQRIEQLQRERRRVLEENHVEHQPRFFRKSDDDSWVSNGTYLELRKDLGFSKLDHPVLW